MNAMDIAALPTLLEVPQPTDPADVAESYGVGFATGYNQAIVESRAAMERYALSVAKTELEKLQQYNGAYIGMGGKRVDKMVHHQVIDEVIADLDARLSDNNKEEE